jgi:small-conductance mechanosensitive channel
MLMSTTDSGASSDSLNLLDADFVDLRQVRRVVGEVYAMRDNLAQTLMNANSIADSLTASFSIFLRILLVFAALWTLNVDVYALWIAFSSSLVALAFVFGGVMKEYFESAVFLFSVHPYDVGDWIVIGEKIQLGSELARAAAVPSCT